MQQRTVPSDQKTASKTPSNQDSVEQKSSDKKMEIYANRRKRLMADTNASIIIIPGASEKTRNNDLKYPFRQENNFYYLTGFNEPNAVLVLIPNRKEGEFILFNEPHDKLMETFNGPRAGQEGACKIYGANESFSIEDYDKKLPELLEGHNKIFYLFGADNDFDAKLMQLMTKKCREINYGREEPLSISDVKYNLQKMRTIKEPDELEKIQKAIDISTLAHMRAMQTCTPNISENKLSRKLMDEFMKQGLNIPDTAYENVVASGKNACTLHYVSNNKIIQNGELVLIDAGAEYQNYAADITRTFPANGKFTPEQRAIYDLVLDAQEACIAAIKPGVTAKDIQFIAVRKITEGLVELGILKGNVEQLIQDNAYSKFFMHGFGHEMGLDVHDDGLFRKGLQPNMVLTVEPGIYISDENKDVDPKWHNIGVRIEDDVKVTEQGCEVLSRRLPKKAEEIEAVMAGFVPKSMSEIGYEKKASSANKLNLFGQSSITGDEVKLTSQDSININVQPESPRLG